MRPALALSVVLWLTGCDSGFHPETLIDDMRLIGVSAEPAII